jgi:two-component system, LytTR family, response regulator
MKINCLIADDEPLAVDLLADYIQQAPGLVLAHKCYNALEALDFLKDRPVDLVFLDINMPQLSGMQLASLLPANTHFIFTTAYSEFAVASYDMNAVDYLLKPITFDRFLKAVNKAIQVIRQDGSGDKEGEEVLFLKTGKRIIRLQYREIWFIEGLKDYVVFHTAQGKHIVYKRMKELEETLPASFSRVHNSYIINRDHLQKIEDGNVFIGENPVPVSEKYKESFLRMVNDKLI